METALESGSSSISLHSWGSDLAEDREEFHGFNNAFARKLREDEASPPLLAQPQVLWRTPEPQGYGFAPPCESVKILLSQRHPMSQHDKECSSKINAAFLMIHPHRNLREKRAGNHPKASRNSPACFADSCDRITSFNAQKSRVRNQKNWQETAHAQAFSDSGIVTGEC
jgi:hypothetical protein